MEPNSLPQPPQTPFVTPPQVTPAAVPAEIPNPTPSPIPPPPSIKKSFPFAKIISIVVGLILLIALFLLLFRFVFPRFGIFQKETTITWWGLWEDSSIVQPIIDAYQAANSKVKITYVAQSKEDYRERLTNSLARGEGPDIFRFHNTWVPMLKSELSALPPETMSAEEYTQTFFPVAVSDLSSGSNILGIPLEYDGLALYINEEIFATYGKTTPKLWDDLREISRDLTIVEDGQIKQSGIALGNSINVDHWQEILGLMFFQNNVDLKNPSSTLAIQTLNYYNSFANPNSNDYTWDETLPPSTSAFASGKLAMFFGPSWRAFEIMDNNPDLRFKVVPVPQLPKSDPSEPDITYATYWVEGVWERSAGKKEAWKFLKHLSSKETLTQLYENARKTRRFGELYPRSDMVDLLSSDPLVSGFISLAPSAKSWYLASRTFDGKTGINTKLGAYLEDAITSSLLAGDSEAALATASNGIQQVLAEYGLIQLAPIEAE